jgi:hypothetical protein
LIAAPRDRGAAINVAFPMRIEPVDFEHCTGHDATFEFSVMLYNYGIVLECVAPYVDVGIHDCFARSSFQRKAYQVYLCARSLLHEVDQGVVQNAPIDLAGQVLLVRTAVSHNLLSSSIDLDLRLDYSEHCHTMMVLLTLVGSQQEFLPISDANMAPAA